jgi:PhnB protein
MEDDMLIPILHFEGNCTDAIALYEKAFNTKAEIYDYGEDNRILHAQMIIHEQLVYLNDAKDFIKNAFGVDFATHLALTFDTADKLLACYELLKREDELSAPFTETSYSKLVGNFIDKFNILWGFMVVD